MHWGRNDAVMVIMRFASWSTFMNMRLVCKRWHEYSRDSTQRWYNWLHEYGPRGGPWTLVGHLPFPCPEGEAFCKKRHHFAYAERTPKILKTMPLCDQVMRIGCERALKRQTKLCNDYKWRTAELRKRLDAAQAALVVNEFRLTATEQAAETLLARLAKRKRKRISISKPL